MDAFDEEQQVFNGSPLDDENLLSGQFWGELRVFLAVAKTKSFNRAAEITNTSQPRSDGRSSGFRMWSARSSSSPPPVGSS